MVGRTPEYLGKKIEAKEVKMAMLAILVPAAGHAGLHRDRRGAADRRVASIGNPGPHGFSEVLYAYTSAPRNNGSAFGGLTGNTPWYNITLGARHADAAVSWSSSRRWPWPARWSRKKTVPRIGGHLPHRMRPLFVGLLVGVILIVGRPDLLPCARARADRRALRRSPGASLLGRCMRIGPANSAARPSPRRLGGREPRKHVRAPDVISA